MKILFDHQIFYLQDFGGISRYFSELISRFNDYGLTTELSILHSNNECLKHLPGIENKVKPKSKPVDPYKSFLRGAEYERFVIYVIQKIIVVVGWVKNIKIAFLNFCNRIQFIFLVFVFGNRGRQEFVLCTI